MDELSVVPDAILDTVVSFLDTCPEVEGVEISFTARLDGESPSVRMLELEVGGAKYLVVAKRVGS